MAPRTIRSSPCSDFDYAQDDTVEKAQGGSRSGISAGQRKKAAISTTFQEVAPRAGICSVLRAPHSGEGLSKPSPVGEGGPFTVDEELASLSTKPYKLLIRLLLRKIHLPSQGKAMCDRARRRDQQSEIPTLRQKIIRYIQYQNNSKVLYRYPDRQGRYPQGSPVHYSIPSNHDNKTSFYCPR